MNPMTYSEELVSAAHAHPSPLAYQRPGPDVLGETILVVFIGRNRDGVWVARDSDARLGGLF